MAALTRPGVDSASCRARSAIPTLSINSIPVRSMTSVGTLSKEMPAANSEIRRVIAVMVVVPWY